MCVCVWMHGKVMLKAEDHFVESVLSVHLYMDSADPTRDARFVQTLFTPWAILLALLFLHALEVTLEMSEVTVLELSIPDVCSVFCLGWQHFLQFPGLPERTKGGHPTSVFLSCSGLPIPTKLFLWKFPGAPKNGEPPEGLKSKASWSKGTFSLYSLWIPCLDAELLFFSCLPNPSGFYVEEVESGASRLLEVEEICKIPVPVFNVSFIFANFLQNNF